MSRENTDEIKEKFSEEVTNEETKEEISEETSCEEGASQEEGEASKEPTIEEELEKAKQEAKDNWDKYLRSYAEFQNYRSRTDKEKSEMYSNGVRSTVEKLLPLIDNFERALDSFENKESADYEGVEKMHKQFLTLLEELGVKEIPAEGESFDPNLHAAVMHIEDEKYDTNVVAEVFQKGYKHGDKVIRPSMVKVAN